jgi:dihydroorotase
MGAGIVTKNENMFELAADAAPHFRRMKSVSSSRLSEIYSAEQWASTSFANTAAGSSAERR